jgi:signal transduction histidine kinase
MLPTFPLPPLYALTLAIVIAMPGIVAAVIVYRAMRAQLAARQHAEQVAAALGRSNRDLEDFAYAASHDLRAPLRSIANLTDWIEEDLGERITDAARSHLQRMRGRLQRLETMVDDLLCFARAGRDLRDVDFELGDVAARAARELGDLAPATIRVAPDLPRLHGDPDAMQQVLRQLLDNALRHGGRRDIGIRIEARPRGDLCEVIVADDGRGIDEGLHERIWAVFETVEPRDRVDRSGIGLALVRKLVEAAGGWVWVTSRPGEGAAFHFTWPTNVRDGSRAPGTARR